jgi:hypothetical protein
MEFGCCLLVHWLVLCVQLLRVARAMAFIRIRIVLACGR